MRVADGVACIGASYGSTIDGWLVEGANVDDDEEAFSGFDNLRFLFGEEDDDCGNRSCGS